MAIKSNKITVKKHEKEFAKSFGGKRQKLSGASLEHKGDAKSDIFLGEAKQTANKSISLKQNWLEKIDKEAMEADRMALMSIKFLNMPAKAPSEWILMPKYVFEMLMEKYLDRS